MKLCKLPYITGYSNLATCDLPQNSWYRLVSWRLCMYAQTQNKCSWSNSGDESTTSLYIHRHTDRREAFEHYQRKGIYGAFVKIKLRQTVVAFLQLVRARATNVQYVVWTNSIACQTKARTMRWNTEIKLGLCWLVRTMETYGEWRSRCMHWPQHSWSAASHRRCLHPGQNSPSNWLERKLRGCIPGVPLFEKNKIPFPR